VPNISNKVQSQRKMRIILLSLLFLLTFPIAADLKRSGTSSRFESLRIQAIEGNTVAQFNLGIAYQFGRDTSKDLDQAQQWYQQASQKGHAGAQFNLAYIFLQKQQDEKAVFWFSQAASSGYAPAQRGLSRMYLEGRGVSRDVSKAVALCSKAAHQGFSEAQFDLGVAYDLGRGVDKDLKKAVIWWRHAAEQGHANAQYNLGVSLEFGQGVRKDQSAAIKWYRLAAVQGHGDAQLNLGSAYANGKGVPRNFVKAHMWLQLASESGLPQAVHNREILAANMAAADIQRSRELAHRVISAPRPFQEDQPLSQP
jgi:uncharacterized protein